MFWSIFFWSNLVLRADSRRNVNRSLTDLRYFREFSKSQRCVVKLLPPRIWGTCLRLTSIYLRSSRSKATNIPSQLVYPTEPIRRTCITCSPCQSFDDPESRLNGCSGGWSRAKYFHPADVNYIGQHDVPWRTNERTKRRSVKRDCIVSRGAGDKKKKKKRESSEDRGSCVRPLPGREEWKEKRRKSGATARYTRWNIGTGRR